jgi:SHS2 domain-containing protein
VDLTAVSGKAKAMVLKRWEHYPHQADVGVRGIGATKAEAFEQASLALTAVIAELETIEPSEPFEITCKADDDEMLLVEWLSRLVYEMSTRRMLFSRFDIFVGEKQLKARIWGESIDVKKHKPAVEVKAVTYCDLAVLQMEDGSWKAQCVVDV